MRTQIFVRRKTFLYYSICLLDVFALGMGVMIVVFIGTHFALAKSNQAAVAFVQKVSIGGAFEIESSQLALDRTQNSDIRRFAQKMVDDHTGLSEKLNSLLPSTGISPTQIVGSLDSRHQKMLDKLKVASSGDFDSDYVSDQTKAHRESVGLFKDYSKAGEDAALKNFAAQTLPILREHQKMVRELKAK
jgi:putative membrane protein